MERPADPTTIAAQEGNVDELEHLDAEHEGPAIILSSEEKTMSMPTISSPSSAYSRKGGARSAIDLASTEDTASSTSVENRTSSTPEKPRALRSGSFNVSSPVVSTDATNSDVFKPSSPPESSPAMAAVSALSLSSSPVHTPVGSPARPNKHGSQSSKSSLRDSDLSEKGLHEELKPQQSTDSSDPIVMPSQSSPRPPSPASISGTSISDAQSTKSFGSFGGFGRDSRRDTSSSAGSAEAKKLTLAAVANAAANAKQWGWNALQRRKGEENPEPVVSHRPLVMGRGQPLPPPGVPLPRPQKTPTAPIPVPKRKSMSPLPPPEMTSREALKPSLESRQSHPLPPPLLPKRRSREESSEVSGDGLFIVSAPRGDSEPTTPLNENTPSYVQPWVEDFEESERGHERFVPKAAVPVSTPPRLPKRRGTHRVLSSSPEEDGRHLPSWYVRSLCFVFPDILPSFLIPMHLHANVILYLGWQHRKKRRGRRQTLWMRIRVSNKWMGFSIRITFPGTSMCWWI